MEQHTWSGHPVNHPEAGLHRQRRPEDRHLRETSTDAEHHHRSAGDPAAHGGRDHQRKEQLRAAQWSTNPRSGGTCQEQAGQSETGAKPRGKARSLSHQAPLHAGTIGPRAPSLKIRARDRGGAGWAGSRAVFPSQHSANANGGIGSWRAGVGTRSGCHYATLLSPAKAVTGGGCQRRCCWKRE